MIAIFIMAFAFGLSMPDVDSKYSKECLEKAYTAEKKAGGDPGDRNYAFFTALESCK